MKKQKNQISIYKLTLSEALLCLIKSAAVGVTACFLCYRDIRSLPLAAGITIVLDIYLQKKTKEKKKQLCLYRFKDFVSSLNTSLKAGYSIENGIAAAAGDMEMLYGKKDIMTCELKNITARLRIRIRVEELFVDLGERSDIDDIRLFARLLAISRRTGGNMTAMLSGTVNVICGKIETRQEIDAQISEKSFEQTIMSLMPAGIIIYLSISFPEIINALYGNAFGRVMMTAALVIYAAGYFWGRKIVDIKL